MEMVLALLAVVLFTTTSMVYSRSMWNQAELLDRTGKVIQATQLAHSRLDEIDAKLFSRQIAFAKEGGLPTIRQAFIGTDIPINLSSGYSYNLSYIFEYCDSLGRGIEIGYPQTYNANAKYVKMSVSIRKIPSMAEKVIISRIYTKTSWNI
jgi:hypothetical protein